MARKESVLESWATRWARSRGLVTAKLTLCNGVPDRIFFLPLGRPAIIEFKKRSEKPSDLQSWYILTLRTAGYNVYWCDTKEEFLEVVAR
jgi:hypothetical protein